MSPKKYVYELPEHPIAYGVQLPCDALDIDDNAQRMKNNGRIDSMARNLIPGAAGSITVSHRDGKYWIVDGQHRWYAFKANGYETVTCEVHEGLTQAQEAVLFLIKNRESAKPNALDEYKVGVTAGVELFVDTDKVLKDHGLEMGSTSANSIGAVAGTLRITDRFGSETLDRVLNVAEMAFGRTPASWDGLILGGLGMLLGKHGDAIDDEKLAEKLARRLPASGWIGQINMRASANGTRYSGTGNRITAGYELFLEEWNKRRKLKIQAS